MTIFVDASVVVAILENEPERDALSAHLRADHARIWSALAFWEAVSALQSGYQRPIAMARQQVAAFGDSFGLEMVHLGAGELSFALDAYAVYGKGRHQAKLNFGDCFAYACAKANAARLLYKGDDFSRTDMA